MSEAPAEGMVWIPGGDFLMGDMRYYREEGPVRRVTVDGFWMDARTVTNRQFARFVKETGHVTEAERAPRAEDYPGAPPEALVPGALVFRPTKGPVDLRHYGNWWHWTPGADWRHPTGPKSSLVGLEEHPVVHVSCGDAEAYAEWAGKDLPTEAEWERAARGGQEGLRFVWGDEDPQDEAPLANTWQGAFPWQNHKLDGWLRTAPVGSFPPNPYGLYDMAGNVWEWTADWFVEQRVADGAPVCCGGDVNPRVADPEKSYDPLQPEIRIPRRVLKGGSFLCAPNYCLRYRPAARSPQMVDTGMSHIGFRCIVRP